MQKSALLREIGSFFLMPFAFPFLMTLPLGMIFAKVYEIWALNGLNSIQAVQTAGIIGLAAMGVYVLYFIITYRIACAHVICHDGETKRIDI